MPSFGEIRSLITHPISLGAGAGIVNGIRKSVSLQRSSLLEGIAQFQNDNRIFIHLRDLGLTSKDFLGGNVPAAYIQGLRSKVNNISDFDIVPHLQHEVIELIPKHQAVLENEYPNLPHGMKAALQTLDIAKGPIAVNLAGVGLGVAGKYGYEKAKDAIKNRVSKDTVTQETSEALKDEISKRASEAAISSIDSSMNIDALIARFSL